MQMVLQLVETLPDMAKQCNMVAITTTGVEEVQSYFSGQTYDQQFEGAGTGAIFDENEDSFNCNNHVIENKNAPVLYASYKSPALDKVSFFADMNGEII